MLEIAKDIDLLHHIKLPINSDSIASSKTLSGAPDLVVLRNQIGQTWTEVKSQLSPNYFVVWRDILLRFSQFFIVGGVYWALAQSNLFGIEITLVPFAVIWLSLAWGGLLAFFHEGAHFNIAKTPNQNDFLANALIGNFLGLDIKTYRRTHWQHHLHLGTPKDTEISYFDPITIRSFWRDLFGLYQFKSWSRYLSDFSKQNKNDVLRVPKAAKRAAIRSALIHFAIVTFITIFISPVFSIVWIVSLAVGAPCINRIRQTLEHRSMTATSGANYRTENHGAVNRVFKGGVLTRIVGSAGFNHHLLHHWDPSLSYTNFEQFYRFLLGSGLRDDLLQSESTYFSVLRKMTKKDK